MAKFQTKYEDIKINKKCAASGDDFMKRNNNIITYKNNNGLFKIINQKNDNKLLNKKRERNDNPVIETKENNKNNLLKFENLILPGDPKKLYSKIFQTFVEKITIYYLAKIKSNKLGTKNNPDKIVNEIILNNNKEDFVSSLHFGLKNNINDKNKYI